MHEHQCLSSFLFFRFQSLNFERERERERGYIKLGIRRNGLKVYLSFFLWWRSCGEYFLFYGLIDFMLFLILAWRTWLLRVRDIFLSSSTRSTGFGSVCHEPCPTTDLIIPFFSLTGRRCHFRFRTPANHLASTFFLPVPGDPREVTEYKHLFLTVILWWLATVNLNKRIVVIIFLSSQWDTTWHFPLKILGTLP